jgi:hypothetical protein
MPQITSGTLIIAIQAVDAQVRQMRKSAERDDAEAEELEMLEAWENAAEDLEAAYDVEARDTLNLPPYDELLGGWRGGGAPSARPESSALSPSSKASRTAEINFAERP